MEAAPGCSRWVLDFYQNHVTEAVDAVLFRLLRERGIPTWKDLADAAGIDKATMSRIRRGQRPLSDHAVALAEALTRSVVDPKEREKRKISAAQLMDMVYQEALTLQSSYYRKTYESFMAGEEYTAWIPDQLVHLEPGDRYYLVTTEKPLEFEAAAGLDDALLEALTRGAYVIYLTASTGGAAGSAESVEGLGSYIDCLGNPDLRLGFESLRRRLKNGLDPRYKEALNHLVLVPVSLPSGSLFMSPYVKYVLIERLRDEFGAGTEAWIEVKYQRALADRCFLSLSAEATVLLRDWCHAMESRHRSDP